MSSSSSSSSSPFGHNRGTGTSPGDLKRKIDEEQARQKANKKQKKKQTKQAVIGDQVPIKSYRALLSTGRTSVPNLDASGPLPIAALRKELIASVKTHATTIVVGETGSGKSTKLAQYLADDLLSSQDRKGCIVCTQPRRVAAVTIAQRVAAERHGKVGEEVGYSIRFEDKTSKRTKIKFVTDGVLVRECMSDPNLNAYTVVILDEAHERSLQTDILMGLLRQLQEKRSNLRLVIMSATLQIDLFMGYFKNPHLVTIPGRQYPVDVLYTKIAEPDYIDAAMLTCLQIHEEEVDGGVLVFLPGQDDIEALRGLLDENLPNVIGHESMHMHVDTNAVESNMDGAGHGSGDGSGGGDKHSNNSSSSGSSSSSKAIVVTKGILQDYELRALYAAMPPEDQLRAFDPTDRGVRKFILSTNIAETSVTISGIKYVVDCGFVKTRLIQPTTGIEMLKVMPISKAQANQRAGRAGRESEGRCFRLFPETIFENLETVTIPEIQRVNVAQVVLQLTKMGCSPLTFPYVSPPSQEVLRKALEMLFILGALEKDMSLSPHGVRMANLPLDPIFAHLLLKSHELGCVNEVVTAVSLLSADNVFLQPYKEEEKKRAAQAHKRFANIDGDLPTLVSIYEAWLGSNKDPKWSSQNYLSQRALSHAASVRQQLSALLHQVNIDATVSCRPEKEPFLRCLAAGLFLNVAKRSVSVDLAKSSSNHRFLSTSQGHHNGGTPFGKTVGNTLILDGNIAPYQTIRGSQPVYIHPSSVLFSAPSGRKLPEYVVYAELLITTKHYMRSISAIDGTWISDANPTFFKSMKSEK